MRQECYLIAAGFHFVIVLVRIQEEMHRGTLHLGDWVKAGHGHDCDGFRIIPSKELG